MININELRIGNFYLSDCDNYLSDLDDKFEKLDAIIKDDKWKGGYCLEATNGNKTAITNVKPIIITEGILIKCRFKYERAISSFTHENMHMWLSLDYISEKFIMYPTDVQRAEQQERIMAKFRNGEGLIPTAEAEYIMSEVRVKYLHQLQNLYFALTEKELEVDL